MSVFVTTMYRYGNREKHSYVLGVWSSREVAMQAGQTEALWRGGKYEPEVTEWKVDANEFDDIGEQRLTPLAPDAGESAASSGIINASAESTSQAEPTPTQRG